MSWIITLTFATYSPSTAPSQDMLNRLHSDLHAQDITLIQKQDLAEYDRTEGNKVTFISTPESDPMISDRLPSPLFTQVYLSEDFELVDADGRVRKGPMLELYQMWKDGARLANAEES